MPRTSLCSYTYNDAALLHGLLESIAAWSVQPDEIILMDDGSATPFSLTEAEKALPIKLLRHERNLGFTRAKHDCISAARGDIILAMDCDSRAVNDYLEACIKVLRDKSIGLVGAMAAPPVTDDYTSWYMYTFSFGEAISPPGEEEFAKTKKTPQKAVSDAMPGLLDTEFIGGSIFALRRELWDEVGGFSGYAKIVHEDSYLSTAIMNKGYQLKIMDRPFRLVRRFNRETLCRRYWHLGRSSGCVEAVMRLGQSLPDTQKNFLAAVSSRCASIAENALTFVFYYYEMLIMCHTFLEFCNALGSQGHLPKEAAKNLLAGIQARLANYPRLWLLLKADLVKLRVLPLKEYPAPPAADQSDLALKCDWSPVLAVFDNLNRQGALGYLESEGVALLLQDEREAEADFSGY